jgi:hypothetical protein
MVPTFGTRYQAVSSLVEEQPNVSKKPQYISSRMELRRLTSAFLK